MGLFVENLLDVLELKVTKAEEDSLSENGMIRSLTTDFTYTKSGKVKESRTLEEIKNGDEKVLQSRTIVTNYVTNNKGDIARITKSQLNDITGQPLSTLEDTRIENSYDKEGKLQKKAYISGTKITGEDFYMYDSEGKLVVKQSQNDNGIGQFIYIYDDENDLVKVVVVESRKTPEGIIPILSEYEIKRNGNGYINSIHRIGAPEIETEFFTHYNDGSITVELGKANKDNILIFKEKIYLTNK